MIEVKYSLDTRISVFPMTLFFIKIIIEFSCGAYELSRDLTVWIKVDIYECDAS